MEIAEVSGAALSALVQSGAPFPPPVGPRERPWRWKSSGYVGEEITQGTLKLDASGKGVFAFTPTKIGYYRARWTSKDGRKRPIESETWTWCVSEDVRELGYSTNGLELVVDKDSFRVGGGDNKVTFWAVHLSTSINGDNNAEAES